MRKICSICYEEKILDDLYYINNADKFKNVIII